MIIRHYFGSNHLFPSRISLICSFFVIFFSFFSATEFFYALRHFLQPVGKPDLQRDCRRKRSRPERRIHAADRIIPGIDHRSKDCSRNARRPEYRLCNDQPYEHSLIEYFFPEPYPKFFQLVFHDSNHFFSFTPPFMAPFPAIFTLQFGHLLPPSERNISVVVKGLQTVIAALRFFFPRLGR